MDPTIAPLSIGGRAIGPGEPTFVVAEISANHNGRSEEAEELVRRAAAAGADAVKVQTYTPDTITLDSRADTFRVSGEDWNGRFLHELYAEAHMPWAWQPRLKALADELGVIFFSSPFDPTAIDFLEGIGVPAYKIASFEIVDIPLIRHAASTGKPLIISTGMATLDEIEEAVDAARDGGSAGVALLKCTSAYPAQPHEMRLSTIADLAARFAVPIGLSDHTLGAVAAVAAVALGASIVEKHITLSRKRGGPDASFSLEPHEFVELVNSVRQAEESIGTPVYGPSGREEQNIVLRRSLFVVHAVRRGDVFSVENVRSIRPASGLHPRFLAEILGRAATVDLAAGTPLTWDAVER